MLNVPGVRERVATLVTIGTPHNGSPVADAIAQQAGPLFDHCPPFLRAQLQFNAGGLHDLTTDAAKEFNSDTRAEGVRCIAVAGNAALAGHELLLFQFAAIVAHETGEENDGVVTRSSAVRPGYEHLPAADWPTDHAGEIGWTLPLPWKVPFLPGAPAPHLARYDDIVSRL